MRKRLVGTAHDTEADMRVAALHERGDDGMEWTLASGENIGMAWLEREAEAAILQNESHSVHGHAGAESFRHALNPAHHVAGPIDDGEIGRISVDWPARRHFAIRFMTVHSR